MSSSLGTIQWEVERGPFLLAAMRVYMHVHGQRHSREMAQDRHMASDKKWRAEVE